eukprot:UN14123
MKTWVSVCSTKRFSSSPLPSVYPSICTCVACHNSACIISRDLKFVLFCLGQCICLVPSYVSVLLT